MNNWIYGLPLFLDTSPRKIFFGFYIYYYITPINCREQSAAAFKSMTEKKLDGLGKIISLFFYSSSQSQGIRVRDQSLNTSVKLSVIVTNLSVIFLIFDDMGHSSTMQRNLWVSISWMNLRKFCLVIVCRQHPGNIAVYLSKYIAPSRPFCIYSPYKVKMATQSWQYICY